ncbi:hypothetical protein [Litoribacter populi]|uniref:hypothetical protein n=1 Tax=Litoribacter populi TaxID=2598460 RepID=UPI00163DB8EE|nr:hypothetical protein [Litoribacter populi]
MGNIWKMYDRDMGDFGSTILTDQAEQVQKMVGISTNHFHNKVRIRINPCIP